MLSISVICSTFHLTHRSLVLIHLKALGQSSSFVDLQQCVCECVLSLLGVFPFLQRLSMLEKLSSRASGTWQLFPRLLFTLITALEEILHDRSAHLLTHTTCLYHSQWPSLASPCHVHQSVRLIVGRNVFLIARREVKMASLVFSICQPLSAVDRCYR